MSNEYPYASMRDSFDLSAYFVVGPEDCKGRPLTDVVDQALHGGATFIQLRAKEADASELTDMARDIAQIIEDNEKSDSVAFVIDDRADVVWQARRKGIKVDGVHIGQTDMEPREARALLGDEAIVGLSAETESLVRLINELPDGCIDYIGAGPLHVSTTKPEASVGGNDGSGKTLDAAQINTICAASEFPVVVGGGVTAADMAMLAGTKAAGWFAVSAIAGAENPEEAARTMVEGWKAVRGDKKHGYAPRVVTHTPATDTQAAQEGAAKPGSEATEKKFTNAKDAKDAQKLAREQEEQEKKDAAAKAAKERKKYGFISVSVGEGLSALFKELNVDWIIEGGQTMNPSTEDMLNAIAEVNADTIYIFPNNKNIVLAANQARDLTEDKEIVVVPTKTIPQGITALISFQPDMTGEENLEGMMEAVSMVKTGQVTYAVRDTRLDEKDIHEGDIMGIGDHGILAVGKGREAVAKEMVAAMVDEDSEVISIYYGAETSEEAANKLAEELEETYPDCEVEVNMGGQPIYYYIISGE